MEERVREARGGREIGSNSYGARSKTSSSISKMSKSFRENGCKERSSEIA